jgi:hypothetical protein
MDSIKVTPEQLEWLDALVLGIFTDMSNAGATLAQILGSIYLSGLNHAVVLNQEKHELFNEKEKPDIIKESWWL